MEKSDRKTRRERERLKMKGEPFPTWFMFYTKRGREEAGGLAVVGCGHRAAKVTVRSGKLFESFQSFRFVSPVASRRFQIKRFQV